MKAAARRELAVAEIAEAAARRFCEKYSPEGLILIGQWQASVVGGEPVKVISLRKEHGKAKKK